MTRLALAAALAYIFIGLVYATWDTTPFIFGRNAGAVAPPWSGLMPFFLWFVLPAVLWPWNLVGRGYPEILVASVYLATVGLFYLAASRRSAPRRLKSTYPDNH